jgi:hypothetical protein
MVQKANLMLQSRGRQTTARGKKAESAALDSDGVRLKPVMTRAVIRYALMRLTPPVTRN